MRFDDDELSRYARQIALPEIGGRGQERLRSARVLVVGAGGLGAPLLLYLAAAGVGTLGLVDDDRVERSYLQRLILYRDDDQGRSKVEAGAQALRAINPRIDIVEIDRRLDRANAADIIGAFEVVADGSDSFTTRDVVAAGAFRTKKPLISASVQGWDGQLTCFKPYLGPPHPCFRCLFPDAPSEDILPTCSQGGVLGPVAGTLGCLQATEVIIEILGIGRSLSGRLLLLQAFDAIYEEILLERSKTCTFCGGFEL
ncbi:MAG: ThiF family adenylyltransferase [Geminicoccaceae bacterium]